MRNNLRKFISLPSFKVLIFIAATTRTTNSEIKIVRKENLIRKTVKKVLRNREK